MKLRILNENYNIDYNEYEILNEGIFSFLSPIIQFFKAILSICKKVGVLILKGTGLAKIGEVILSVLGELTIVKRFTDPKTKEQEAKDIIKSISIGDTFADVNRIINKLSFILWKGITLDFPPFNTDGQSVEKNANFWKSVFNAEKRTTWLQKWYTEMIASGIHPSHAKAYMVIVSFWTPIYNIWYNFKPWWVTDSDSDKEKRTLEDKLHPFTAGQADTDEVTGLNKADERVQKDFRKILSIQKNENLTDLQKNAKIGRLIAWESLKGFALPAIMLSFDFFRDVFGFGKESFAVKHLSGIIKFIICAYYFYFLISSLMISSLAIEQKEKFDPSEDTAVKEGGLELNNDDEKDDDNKK